MGLRCGLISNERRAVPDAACDRMLIASKCEFSDVAKPVVDTLCKLRPDLLQFPVSAFSGLRLFSVQHRFETARWMEKGNWNFVEAALQG